MGSLMDQTEIALAAVLGLCGGITQEDVGAVQRHDEAAIALFDVNEDDAAKALKPWIKCLETWARPRASGGDQEGPWSTMTQPSSTVLSKGGNEENTPPSSAATPLVAHKALSVVLFRVMLLGNEVQGSPHRDPAPAAWMAGRAYLLMLSLPGAGAYGILQPAVLGMLLTNLRSWCRNSVVYRPGGVSAQAGVGDSGTAAAASAGAAASASAGGKRKGSQKRRRGSEAAGGYDSESGEESDGGGGSRTGAKKGRRGVGAARARGGGGGGMGGGGRGEVLACVTMLNECLACVPLASHQDLAVKLSEVMVGVSVIAAVEGPPALGELASVALVELAAGASGREEATHGAVLKALMPVILMATGKADVPPRSKDCLKAHDHAIGIVKAIAVALRSASHERIETRVSPPSASGNPALPGEERSENLTPASSPFTGDGSGSSHAAKDGAEDSGDGNQLSAVIAGKGGGVLGATAPVLTMVARLCVSAPDRAEGRVKLAGGIAAVLPELDESDRDRFVEFLAKFSRNARITHRGFAVELSSRLLAEAWPWESNSGVDSPGGGERNGSGGRSPVSPTAGDVVPVEGNGDAGESSPGVLADGGGKTMLDVVVARAWDRAPTVRSKAASTLSDVLSGLRGDQSGYTGEGLRKAVMEACGWRGERTGSDVPRDGPLLEVVRTRVQDEKPNVRRNAVPALEALLSISPAFSERGSDSWRDLAVEHSADFVLLEERCNDVSLSTRKAAMTALSSLLMERPGDDYLQSAWVRALMPLASDPEQTCQNRLVELVRSVILDRVVEWHRGEIVAEKAKGSGRSGRGKATAASIALDGGEGSGEGSGKTDAGGLVSVWPLLAKAGHGDAHKCLKKVISTLTSQKDSGFKAAPLLKALRSAAVIALPPKAAAEGTDDSEEAGEWDAEDLRLLSLAGNLPRASLTTIRRGTWALLEAFLDRSPSAADGGKKVANGSDMDPMFVVRCWNRIRGHILEEALSDKEGALDSSAVGSEEAFESDGRRVLGVLARLARSVPAEVATPLAERLLEMLMDLVARPETSAALVGALHMLCFAQAGSEEAGAAMCNAWANHALSSFEGLLDVFIYQGSGALQGHAGAQACGGDMARLVERLLFAVGEVVAVGFTGKEDAAGPSDPQVPGTSAAKSVTVRPVASPRLVKLVQVLLPPRLPTSAHGVEEGGEGPVTPSAVRALAFVTLGHMCMRDKGLAKTSVNILVRELDTADDAAVRSNALVVLGDLCVRYTAMVDRHVGAMAACLQDAHPLVRRHAILLISQLLLQDYVKWRGLLLYRFLATLVDCDSSVRDLGAFTLTRPLINKTPGLFAQNFVEALFVLNNYSEHPCYMAAAAGRADAGGGVTMEGIDLGGDNPAQAGKRMSVYSTMLEHMSDEGKITVTAKLAQEVLSAAVEGGLPITTNDAASSDGGGESRSSSSRGRKSYGKGPEFDARRKASSVVKDALTVMASPGIRVGGRGGAAAGDMDDGSEDMASQQSGPGGLAAAKSKLLSKVALKHLMETVVPILIALKHALERAHSPLLRELMFYFGELYRSHKEDVKAVLACEAGLVEEMEFDLRRFEKEEAEKRIAKEAAAAAAAAAIATPSMGPPRTPRARRSMGGGGASGRRDSCGPGVRAPRTPMAAVRQSARKTPFQNLGACSAVRLKGSASSVFSPAASRGSRPKTPLHLRTPREAVAAALGNSPVAISPMPMRSMPARDEKAPASAPSIRTSGSDTKGADIQLDSPVSLYPAKKRRWSVCVPIPPGGASGNGGGGRSDAEDIDSGSNGGVPQEEGGVSSPPEVEDMDEEDNGGVERKQHKENNPVAINALMGKAGRGLSSRRRDGGGGTGGGGAKGKAAAASGGAAAKGKRKAATDLDGGSGKDAGKTEKVLRNAPKRGSRKDAAVVDCQHESATPKTRKPLKAKPTATAKRGRRSSRTAHSDR